MDRTNTEVGSLNPLTLQSGYYIASNDVNSANVTAEFVPEQEMIGTFVALQPMTVRFVASQLMDVKLVSEQQGVVLMPRRSI